MEDKEKVRRPPVAEELPLPWLMCTHGTSKHKQVQTFYSPTSTKSCVKSIPQFRNKNILLSHQQHGWWFLLQDRKEPSLMIFFNLETSQAFDLPTLPPAVVVECAVLSASPVSESESCLLLLLCSSVMLFCRPARPDCSWVTQGMEAAIDIRYLAPLNGVIYAISDSELYYFKDVDEDNLRVIPLQIRTPVFDFFHIANSVYLVEFSDSNALYYVCHYLVSLHHYTTSVVKVCRLDLENKVWLEVKSLDGHAIFLCKGNSLWCWGTQTPTTTTNTGSGSGSGIIEANSIYFRPTFTKLKIVYAYNLVDQSWTTLSPFPRLVNPSDDPLWLVPRNQQQQLRLVDLNSQTDYPDDKELTQHAAANDDQSLTNKLPFDIIELIVDYMHLFEYWNFRASCKIVSSQFPPHRGLNNDDPPFFMTFNNNHGHGRRVCKIMDPFRQDARINNSLPLPSPEYQFTLEFAKDGWILYLVGKSSLHFISVFTGVRGSLPPILDLDEYKFQHHVSIAFSTDPTCSDCLTVAIYDYYEAVGFRYLRHGDEAWTVCDPYFHEDYHDHIRFRPISSTPVFLDGAFYYLDKSGYLGKFKLTDDDEDPSWQVYDRPQIQGDDFDLGCLVECEGELYSVFVGKMGCWVQVFWFDFSEEDWVEIDYMEDVVLCISRKSSVSIVSENDRMRNKIFLPRLKGKSAVSYSQDTMMYHILAHDDDDDDDDDVMKDLHGTKEPLSCCWI